MAPVGAAIHSPFKSSEHTRGPRGPASTSRTSQQFAEEDGEGDESGKPEEHGERLDGQDGELVGGAREEPWRESQVDEGEKRPEGGEYEEVDLRRGSQVGVIVIPVRDC